MMDEQTARPEIQDDQNETREAAVGSDVRQQLILAAIRQGIDPLQMVLWHERRLAQEGEPFRASKVRKSSDRWQVEMDISDQAVNDD